MKSLAAIFFLTASSVPALALQVPPAGGADAHVRIVAYNPYDRTRIVGVMNHATTITFAPSEHIVRVLFGSENDWRGPDPKEVASVPLGNILPLWPLRVGESNMQVVTADAKGDQRVYQYDLVAHDDPGAGKPDDPDAIYGLIYTYPRDRAAAAAVVAAERREIAAKRRTEDRLAVDAFYGERNWKYIAQGRDRWLAPTEVSDNGRLTAFRFQGNTQIPTILAVGRAGDEQVAQFTRRDDLVVMQSIACHWRMRLGRGVLEVFNKAPDCASGTNPGTGTTSPDVVRQLVTENAGVRQ